MGWRGLGTWDGLVGPMGTDRDVGQAAVGTRAVVGDELVEGVQR
jgi:hypothetical protein